MTVSQAILKFSLNSVSSHIEIQTKPLWGSCIGYPPTLHNCIWLSLSAINHINIKSLIHNHIITKGFLLHKKHHFDFSIIFYAVTYYFQYVDPTCLICYLIAL